MNGEGILGSGVPAKVGTSDCREFRPDVESTAGQNLRRPPGPPTPKMTTSFMGLQITTHTQTREIEEERKRKNGVKTQGTLKLGLRHHGSTLNRGKGWRKNETQSSTNKSTGIISTTKGFSSTPIASAPRSKGKMKAWAEEQGQGGGVGATGKAPDEEDRR